MKSFLAIFLLFLNTAVSYASEKPFTILVISSFNEMISWSESFRDGIVEESKAEKNIRFYFEYLDSTGSGADISNEQRADVISEKYGDIKFDAVIADSDAAWSLLNTDGRRLFGSVPFVVYSSQEPSLKSPDILFLTPNIRRAVKRTLEMAFAQNPDADTVYLVTSDYSSSRNYEQYIKSIMNGYPDKRLEVVKNFTYDELYKKIASLPRNGFILFQIVFSDRSGVYLTPKMAADEVVARSSVPVYGFYSSLMGSGMAGGQMIDAFLIASNMLKAAVDMSAGKTVRPEDIRMTRRYADWNAVKKYDLHFHADQPDTTVLHKPVSVFTQYKKEIIIISAAMAMMAALIVVLVALTIRLKKANSVLIMQKSIIVNQSKMAGMGEMLEAIAHRWIQPLNTLSLFHSMLEESGVLKKADDPILAKTHQSVIRSLDDMGRTIDDFTSFFDTEKFRSEFKLRKVFEDSMVMVGKVLRRIEVTFEDKSDVSVVSYEKELKQIFINIIMNAKDAFEEKKTPDGRININVSENVQNNTVKILIADNAGGVSDDVMPNIFDPFFTTKGVKRSGFGLYLVRLILEDSIKGSVSAFNNGSGTTFEIIIPKN